MDAGGERVNGKIDPRRSNVNRLPFALPFSVSDVTWHWNLVYGIPDGRVLVEEQGVPRKIITESEALAWYEEAVKWHAQELAHVEEARKAGFTVSDPDFIL